jgi:hypothetical protein
MALGVGSVVMMSLSSADLPENTAQGPDVQPQPPVLGVVEADAGGGVAWDISWGNGNRTLAVPSGGIQDLYSVSPAERARLFGRVVSIDGESAEYWGQVVEMYRRGSTESEEKALVCMFSTGAYREVNTSALVAVPGR